MKKKIFIALLLIVISLGLGFFIYVPFSLVNTKTYSSNLIVDKENNLLTLKENKEIKILQLSDIQISNFLFAGYAFDIVKTTIKKAKPDMIVLTGDNLTSDSDERLLKKYASFMDSFELPWALVYGNHDYEINVPIERQNELYESYKYSLFKTGDITGYNGNYYYNIKRGNDVVFSLMFMESKLEGFEEAQINWYEQVINSNTSTYGKVIDSMLFFHIPIKELQNAYDAYVANPEIGSGVIHEELSLQTTNNNLFEKAVNLKSTKAFAFGHDHVNNLIIKYQDILFCYSLKTGRTTYYRRNMMGGNLYTINLDNSISVERIYV